MHGLSTINIKDRSEEQGTEGLGRHISFLLVVAFIFSYLHFLLMVMCRRECDRHRNNDMFFEKLFLYKSSCYMFYGTFPYKLALNLYRTENVLFLLMWYLPVK